MRSYLLCDISEALRNSHSSLPSVLVAKSKSKYISDVRTIPIASIAAPSKCVVMSINAIFEKLVAPIMHITGIII